jgi:hypothetical protein
MPDFDVYGTMLNTFGQFVTAFNTDFEVQIDLLNIELVNPYIAIGGNPVGLDNIVVDLAGTIPEPGSIALLLGGLVALTFMRRRSEVER